ncbi:MULTISPECIES: hypothetical protein [unclassified Methylobacterium]|uniref:hypothetical protein n=1 Tax=unclassified Methylobacterium TaxID=2615210 RepID=UPI00226A7CB8|nr:MULTISPECIES: hypothetical protein [unclassified Methylobacterium]
MKKEPNQDFATADIDWDKTNPDVAKHIFTQSETYLRAQMQIALDADKRALGLAGFFTTFSTALIAACVTYYNVNKEFHILVIGLIGACLAFTSAVLSYYSARPMLIAPPGNYPESYWAAIGESAAYLYGQEAQNYQSKIKFNENFLNTNARYVRWAMRIFVSIPLVLVITYYLHDFSSRMDQAKLWACQASVLHHVLACD